MKIKDYLLALTLVLTVNSLHAQMELTLDKAIDISIQQSPELQNSELNLERYKSLLNAQEASLKSQFRLNVDPFEYSNSRRLDPRLSQWYTNESLSSMGTFSISQPILWTGSTISLNNKFGWQNNVSTIDGQGEESTTRAFSNSLYLSFNQPLFTYNELKYELMTIAMDYENARLSYAITRLNLEQRIVSQFYSIFMLQQQLLIAEEEIENAKANYDIISEQVKMDMSPRSELFQAELNLSNAESSLENNKLSLDSAKDNFKQLIGVPLDTDIAVIAEVSERSVMIDPDLAVKNALTNRLELQQRDITNKNAEIDLMKVRDNGSFDGELALSFGLMGDNAQFQNVYENPTRSPSVSVSLSIPIFDWGARRNRIKAQELKMEMNQIDEDQELIDIEIEVVQSCRTLNNLERQINIAETSLKNAQLTYDLNVEYYRAGEITGMEMDEFQSQLSTQKMSLAQKLVDYKLELLNLKCLSLYDFEKGETISPMSMYSTETISKYDKYKNKR